jgi:hypothetical protein
MKQTLALVLMVFGLVGCASTSSQYEPMNGYMNKKISLACQKNDSSFANYPVFSEDSFDEIFQEISKEGRPIKDIWETDAEYQAKLDLFLQKKGKKKIYKLLMDIDFPCRDAAMHSEACYDVETASLKIIFRNYSNFEKAYQTDYESEYSKKYGLLMIENTEERLKFKNLKNLETSLPISRQEMKSNMEDYKFYILFSVNFLERHNNNYETERGGDWERIAKSTSHRDLRVNHVGFSLEKNGSIINQTKCL